MTNKLRLYSGLTLFVFVCGHFINHSLGLISVEMMDKGALYLIDPWRTSMGTVILFGAFIIHGGVALWALWKRRTLKMPAWEATQIIAGLLTPLLLAGHIAGTRGLVEMTAFDPSYSTTLNILWNVAPLRGGVQALALIVIWVHACVGLHNWLKLKPGYQKLFHVAFASAMILPTLALAGYVSAGIQVQGLADPMWILKILSEANFDPAFPALATKTETQIQVTALALITLVLVGRHLRGTFQSFQNKPKLYYSPDRRVVPLQRGATLLETIRNAGIAHASVCGGRGRCSTCRVHILKGADQLPLPENEEKDVLARVTSSPSIRLACQIRPEKDIEVAALVPMDIRPNETLRHQGYRQGSELDVAFLFVDLRGSTKLSEERLPFDVVFILNQFFAELSLALKETNGHYAQFNGDGLLAIYGLESGAQKGCQEAIEGAKAMFRRIGELNERIRAELGHDLEIGIGIHAGEAIVGSMGPPQSPIVSALGDNVNIAARLEAQTKELGAPLVVSARTARQAGINLSEFKLHTIQVKGRDRPLDVYAVDDVSRIPGVFEPVS